MKQPVSRVRTRKTKSREKQAGKASVARTPLNRNPVIGLLVTFLLWATTVFLIGMPHIIKHPTDPARVLPLTGDAAFLLIGLFASCLFLQMVSPKVLTRNTTVLLLALTSLICTLPAKALITVSETTSFFRPEITGFMLPLGMAPLLATILVNSTAAIGLGVWTALVMAVLGGRSFPLLVAGVVATLVAAQTARRVRTRSKVVKVGLLVGLSEMVCVFGLTAINWDGSDVVLVLHQGAACLLSGFFSAILVLLVLPVFEVLFGVTTDITLLELSDLSHPLLQRLAIQAPGTYHHSLVVASLAQAAAEEIGANDLLTRVSAYFHDVGKLTKPEFFTENLQLQSNPHDDLPPSMSTLVITAHVKEGLSLAMLHKLPKVVMNAIAEHHGTSLLSYFHHKAKAQVEVEPGSRNGPVSNGKPKVDEGPFRYAGPRPSSRESAVICLADAVEAASRSMDKTTPSHIEGLVDDITNTRLLDGQLAESDLTFAELTKVKRAFVFTLTNMLHGRVPYPKDEDRDKRAPKAAPDEQIGHKEADTLSPAEAAPD